MREDLALPRDQVSGERDEVAKEIIRLFKAEKQCKVTVLEALGEARIVGAKEEDEGAAGGAR